MPARTWPHAPTASEPPTGSTLPDHRRPEAGSRRSPQELPVSARSSVRVSWTTPPSCSIRSRFGDRAALGPVSTTCTSRPRRAPAAAVSRQWLDQRRPDVTIVAAPSCSAAPSRNSRLRSLLPEKASGPRSSRLIQSSTRPPSASESRGSGCSGVGPSSSRARGRSGRGRVATRGSYRARRSHRAADMIGPWRSESRPRTASSAPGRTPTWNARSRSPRRPRAQRRCTRPR